MTYEEFCEHELVVFGVKDRLTCELRRLKPHLWVVTFVTPTLKVGGALDFVYPCERITAIEAYNIFRRLS